MLALIVNVPAWAQIPGDPGTRWGEPPAPARPPGARDVPAPQQDEPLPAESDRFDDVEDFDELPWDTGAGEVDEDGDWGNDAEGYDDFYDEYLDEYLSDERHEEGAAGEPPASPSTSSDDATLPEGSMEPTEIPVDEALVPFDPEGEEYPLEQEGEASNDAGTDAQPSTDPGEHGDNGGVQDEEAVLPSHSDDEDDGWRDPRDDPGQERQRHQGGESDEPHADTGVEDQGPGGAENRRYDVFDYEQSEGERMWEEEDDLYDDDLDDDQYDVTE